MNGRRWAIVTVLLATLPAAATAMLWSDQSGQIDQVADGPPRPVSQLISEPAPIFRAERRWQPLVGDSVRARETTMQLRSDRRAFDGAPPLMPHSRNFAGTKECLDCHRDGFRLGNRFGAAISHPHLVACEQCHVESRNLEVPPSVGLSRNSFEGLEAPVRSIRPWTGAPPVIPHSTLMRTDCLSCHGPQAWPGLRTDHPQRTSCTQCHAVAASLDQTSPFFTGRPTLVLPPEPVAPDNGPEGP